jgi:phenylacetate-CoA ligase
MYTLENFLKVVFKNMDLKDYIYKFYYKSEYKEYINTLEYIYKNKENVHNLLFSKCVKELKYLDKLNLLEYPIIDKDDLRRVKINADNSRYKGKLFNTGGSTGSPFEFYLSRMSGINEYYHQKHMYYLHGYVSGDTIASFDGSQPSYKSISKKRFFVNNRLLGFPYGHIKYSSHYYNKENEIYFLNSIKCNKPKFIRGYPSFIHDISKGMIKHNIRINGIKAIFLTSETILPQQVEVIKEAFNCKVYGQYGNSEATVFAVSQSGFSNYVCSPIYGQVEVLNDKMKHVEIGEIGEIVTTSYFTRHTPFIRYRTGDMAEYGGIKDDCKILKQIHGRKGDYILDIHGNKINITGLIFGQHYKCFKYIKQWQIIQNKIGEIDINIIPINSEKKYDYTEIKQKITDCVDVRIDIIIVNDIQKTISGKTKFVVNNIGLLDL